MYGQGLSMDPGKNTAGVAVQAFINHVGCHRGFEIILEKNLPLGSGLGSSAASAAAAVYAANELYGNPLTIEALIPFAMEAERVACGTAHADNVAPALLGGFVLIRSYDPLDIVHIPCPEGLYCTLLHPHVELRTEDARKILRSEITLKDAIIQWSNVAGLIAGLTTGNFPLIGRSLQDVIIEPLRSVLIPGFDEIKQAAVNSGVLGCSISGSGPSVFALSTDEATAQRAGKAMQKALAQIELSSDLFVSRINLTGAQTIHHS
jgi:homoserine kinase